LGHRHAPWPQRDRVDAATGRRRDAAGRIPGVVQRRSARPDGELDLTAAAMGIQQTAGNRALRDLIAHATPGPRHEPPKRAASQRPAVQRYTVVPAMKQRPGYWMGEWAALRVADDGSMAVKHTQGTPDNTRKHQVFYALPSVIAASAQALQNIGSAFSIGPGSKTMKGRPPGSKDKKATQTLVNAVVANADLARIGKGDYAFNACTQNLNNFLGITRGRAGDPEKLDHMRNLTLKLRGSLDHDRKTVVLGEDLSYAMIEARKIATGSDSSPEARQAYNTMSESMRKLISQQYGIDEHAVPDPGEGYGITQQGDTGRSGMGHFAPVIAASGADRVTLENDVSQVKGRERPKVGDINPNWYFRMFGPAREDDDQSFYGEALKYERDDYGDRPMVTTIGSVPRDDEKKE
jgi:hypothetical protein